MQPQPNLLLQIKISPIVRILLQLQERLNDKAGADTEKLVPDKRVEVV